MNEELGKPSELKIHEAKPHKGRIRDWQLVPCDAGIGYYVTGRFMDHPYFAGQVGHTSYLMAYDPATGKIETRNSRYTLYGPQWPEK